MPLSIERRLQLMGDVSNLMLMGSIHVYGAKKSRVRVTLNETKKESAHKRAA